MQYKGATIIKDTITQIKSYHLKSYFLPSKQRYAIAPVCRIYAHIMLNIMDIRMHIIQLPHLNIFNEIYENASV